MPDILKMDSVFFFPRDLFAERDAVRRGTVRMGEGEAGCPLRREPDARTDQGPGIMT